MKIKYLILFILICQNTYCQFQVSKTKPNDFWTVKKYSNEEAVFLARKYVFKNILKIENEIGKFEVISLSAANSGELTTLFYRSEDKNTAGLLLVFFGEYLNDNGVYYNGYTFKNFSQEEAKDFLSNLNSAIEDNLSYLKSNTAQNNIFFTYNDIEALIYNGGLNIRIFYENFDSNWDRNSFERSRRQFDKNSQ